MNIIDTVWGIAGFAEDAGNAIWGIITSIYDLVTTIYTIISDFMQLFPPIIQAVIMTAITISVAFYIYNNYISGIMIAGFKLP